MQQKKEDEYFPWLLQMDNYLIYITKNPTETSIQITFKNNKFRTQRTLIIFVHNPLKRLYQFHNRNQVNLLILSCIPIISYFKAL